MKPIGLISTAVLLLILGVAVPAYAQEQATKPRKAGATSQAGKATTGQTAETTARGQAGRTQEQQQPAKAQQEKQAQQPKQQNRPSPHGKINRNQPKLGKLRLSHRTSARKTASRASPSARPAGKGQGQAKASNHASNAPGRRAETTQLPALRLSARGEGRVPDDRFRANFGEGHTFVIRNR